MEKVINVDQEILGGTPVFMGTRVPIKNLFDYLEGGETIGDFLEDFPSVGKGQVDAVLKMSHELLMNLTRISHENFA